MDDFEPINIETARRAKQQAQSAPEGSGFAQAASASSAKPIAQVTFDRHELREILNLYGRMVAQGEWRDYAIDFSPQLAVFSVFRRTSEMPLYRIEKNPKLARKQVMYAVVTATGLILKRGHELAKVIAVLDKKLKVVSY